jgi:hypothetical protein
MQVANPNRNTCAVRPVIHTFTSIRSQNTALTYPSRFRCWRPMALYSATKTLRARCHGQHCTQTMKSARRLCPLNSLRSLQGLKCDSNASDDIVCVNKAISASTHIQTRSHPQQGCSPPPRRSQRGQQVNQASLPEHHYSISIQLCDAGGLAVGRGARARARTNTCSTLSRVPKYVSKRTNKPRKPVPPNCWGTI